MNVKIPDEDRRAPEAPRGPHQKNWNAVTPILTAVGLCISLWYYVSAVKQSTRAVEQSTRAVEQSTRANDLQLLTQMHRAVTESSGHFYSKHRSELINYLSNKKPDLSNDAWIDLHKMLTDIEYLAFLFNRGYIKDEQAREMWIPIVRGQITNGFDVLKKHHEKPAEDYPECQKILEKTAAPKHQGVSPDGG